MQNYLFDFFFFENQVTVISQLRKLKFPQGFIEKYPEEVCHNLF
jgi:hypothetical protein